MSSWTNSRQINIQLHQVGNLFHTFNTCSFLWVSKFHTHIKQKVNYSFMYFTLLFFENAGDSTLSKFNVSEEGMERLSANYRMFEHFNSTTIRGVFRGNNGLRACRKASSKAFCGPRAWYCSTNALATIGWSRFCQSFASYCSVIILLPALTNLLLYFNSRKRSLLLSIYCMRD